MIPPRTVRLEFNSAFDMLDFVQVVCDHVGKSAGLDEDQMHWVSVDVRESVVNAIKHGNKNDPTKRVTVDFSPVPGDGAEEFVVRIEDQGEGFVPEEVADPLAPENILKSSGRGIFLIRNFMDETVLKKVPGGMEIRMVKKLQKETA
jgi:serine/threonine-protein kinase RsbW